MHEILTLSASTSRGASDARHALAAHLDSWSCDRTADSLLVFSELVANAVKHARGATSIFVDHGDQTLRFEVHDRTHDRPAIREHAGPRAGSGSGSSTN